MTETNLGSLIEERANKGLCVNCGNVKTDTDRHSGYPKRLCSSCDRALRHEAAKRKIPARPKR